VVRVGEDPVDHLARAVAHDRVDEDVLAELVEQPPVPCAVVGEPRRGIGGGVAQREEPAGAASSTTPSRAPPTRPRDRPRAVVVATARAARPGGGLESAAERAVPGGAPRRRASASSARWPVTRSHSALARSTLPRALTRQRPTPPAPGARRSARSLQRPRRSARRNTSAAGVRMIRRGSGASHSWEALRLRSVARRRPSTPRACGARTLRRTAARDRSRSSVLAGAACHESAGALLLWIMSEANAEAAGWTCGTRRRGRGRSTSSRAGSASRSWRTARPARSRIIEHTEVSDELRGRGRAQARGRGGSVARASGMRVVPICPYARSVFDRDAALRDVLCDALVRGEPPVRSAVGARPTRPGARSGGGARVHSRA
jgi:predicted GNAT family acetyltransferase